MNKMTIKDLLNILSQYSEDCLIELDVRGGEWACAELIVYTKYPYFSDTIMEVDN